MHRSHVYFWWPVYHNFIGLQADELLDRRPSQLLHLKVLHGMRVLLYSRLTEHAIICLPHTFVQTALHAKLDPSLLFSDLLPEAFTLFIGQPLLASSFPRPRILYVEGARASRFVHLLDVNGFAGDFVSRHLTAEGL